MVLSIHEIVIFCGIIAKNYTILQFPIKKKSEI